MKNISDIPYQTRWTALASLEGMGIKIPDALFKEWAEWAIDVVGRNDLEIRIATKVRENGEVPLPCDVSAVEAATLDMDIFETWKGTPIDEQGKRVGMKTLNMDHSPVSMPTGLPYIDFQVTREDSIQVTPSLKGQYVYVKAKTYITDRDGELLFTNKQIRAIMYYVIAIKAERDYLTGNTGIDPEKAMKRAQKLVAASRVPDELSDNEIDRILNVKVSFDRKMYNKDFKIND